MCRGPPLGCVWQQRLRLKALDATFDSFEESDWWSVDISGEDAHGRRGSWPGWQEAEKARWEREGQWLARLTGRNLARRGDFLRLFPKI